MIWKSKIKQISQIKRKIMTYKLFEQYKNIADLLNFARETECYESGKIMLDKLCGLLKIPIKYDRLNFNQSGYLKFINDVWIIGINRNHYPNRQRFTIAHELGHLFLHVQNYIIEDEIIDYTRHGDKEITSIERNADKFAAELLMPERDIDKKFSAENPIRNVIDFADYYGVSEQAMEIKLYNIGYKIKKPLYVKYK